MGARGGWGLERWVGGREVSGWVGGGLVGVGAWLGELAGGTWGTIRPGLECLVIKKLCNDLLGKPS